MIPFIIRILHPRLKTDVFLQLCKDVTFTNRIAFLCEDCYLYVTMSSKMGGKFNYKVKENDLLGTQ